MQKLFQVPQPNVLLMDVQRGGMNTALGSAKETLSGNSVFFPGLKRPAGFDDLLNKAITEGDVGKRVSLLEKMDALAYGEAMFIPLWTSPHIMVYHPYVRGFVKFIGNAPKEGFDDVWLDK